MKKMGYIIGLMIVCGGLTRLQGHEGVEAPQGKVVSASLKEKEGEEEEFTMVCRTATSIRVACVGTVAGGIGYLFYYNIKMSIKMGKKMSIKMSLMRIVSAVIGLIGLYSAVLALMGDQVSLTFGPQEVSLPSWSLDRGLWGNILFLYTHPVRTTMERIPYDTIDTVEKKGGLRREGSSIKLPMSVVITCKDGRSYWIPQRYCQRTQALDKLVGQLGARGVKVV